MQRLCSNCGADLNEPTASYCDTCGCRLGSSLYLQPAPPPPLQGTPIIDTRYEVQNQLWTGPTYNAYTATSNERAGDTLTIVEQQSSHGNAAPASTSRKGGRSAKSGGVARFVESLAELKDAAAAFDQFGLMRPRAEIVENGNVYTVFDQIHGQPIAHLDQTSEKQARAIGLQLCDLAEQFHTNGWVFNGFEPYSVMVDREGKVRLISFDRVRPAGAQVDQDPIYPSRGYTAPELFEEGAQYDARSDIYSLAALLLFLLTGEETGLSEGSSLYPIATVAPRFERLLGRALAEKPAARFQSVAELRSKLTDLNLPVVLQSGHFTDVGLIRDLNEDSVLALNLTQYYESVQTQIGLYIVSDGMGGEAAGEVASRITVRAIAEFVTENLISASLKSTRAERIVAHTQTGGLRLAVADGNELATTELLRLAIMNANREVLNYARTHPQERGLGATATVAMVVGELLTVAQVGDSRCYLLSEDRLEQLTEDHSLVQRMINTGSLSRSEARLHPYRNVIYRSIGADDQIECDIIRRQLNTGDVILLCSDGLNGMLSDDQIRDILMVNPDPNLAAKELVVAANSAGGEDNISALVARLN